MRTLKATRQFERDVKLARRRGRDLSKLWAIVECLTRGEALAARHRAHRLSGEWRNAFECHIAPDWLLVWQLTESEITLVRTGTHADLFG